MTHVTRYQVRHWAERHATEESQLRRATAEAATLHVSTDPWPLVTAWANASGELVPVFSEPIALDVTGRTKLNLMAHVGAVAEVVCEQIATYVVPSTAERPAAPLAAFTCRYIRHESVFAMGTDLAYRLWHSEAGLIGVWGSDTDPDPAVWSDLTEVAAAALTLCSVECSAAFSTVVDVTRGGGDANDAC